MLSPPRVDGYAPIRDYAAIGDGQTVALLAADGAVDWWCVPRIDSPSVFGALLDAAHGGSFRLLPASPFKVERRYLPGTNVLEATFTTDRGVVRTTDAMNLETGAPLPWRELARRVEGVSGTVDMTWQIQPRFDYARRHGHIERWHDAALATAGDDAIGIFAWDAGIIDISEDTVAGEFTTTPGSRSLLALAAARSQPRPYLRRDEVELRLESTCDTWSRWAQGIRYDGRWRDAVVRSALALQLLVDSTTGAIIAAPTTSLPERIGGPRNYDYRYMWVRDSSFTLDAFIDLNLHAHAHASFAWLLDATAHTHPRLQPIYRGDGAARLPSGQLDLHGYRGSQPVHLGNSAGSQRQLGNYGDLLETAWRYVREGHRLHTDAGVRIADIADLICEIWTNDDNGIWELPGEKRPYTISKMGCWVTLDRTIKLVDADQVPARHMDRWHAERAAVHDFVEQHCWSEEHGAYAAYAGGHELDAATLLAARTGFADPAGPRMAGTIAAIRRELGHGPFIYRYSGMQTQEGAFVACSFWLVEALALARRLDEAADVMDAVVAATNDVGLFSEEMDPASGDMLGNFPQGLSHLALINAAVHIAQASSPHP